MTDLISESFNLTGIKWNKNHILTKKGCGFLINKSIWQGEFTDRDSLREDIKTTVAIIGGGMAGLLIALHLKEAGVPCVILEARRIASGQTKNTTAKITAQHGYIYHNLIKNFGEEKARLYLKANLDAVKWYASYINENEIDCDFKEQSAYIYSIYDTKDLEREQRAYNRLGVKTELLSETELPFNVAGALRLEKQGQFDPLAFISHISKDLNIYENTRVIRVEGNTLVCKNARIQAQHIVFACHYPFVNFPGLFFTRLHQERSYFLALEKTPKINGMYLGIDDEPLSFRQAGDYLLLGGSGHRTGESSVIGRYDRLLFSAKTFYPDCTPSYKWSAQDCITADNVPYIGKFGNENTYIATGFGKWGMTTSAVAARLITDLIIGVKNPYQKVFTPERFSKAALSGISKEIFHSARGLIRQNLVIPEKTLESIPVGHGGIVKYQGKKVGVYRQSAQEYHVVDTKCPHLGCRLEFNPDEKTWDCPCHGSRFDYMGRLIDNPAQKNLPCITEKNT